MSSNLRQPSRIAEYSAEGSYYPRELVEKDGELYLVKANGTTIRLNPSGITTIEDSSNNEIGSIDPTLSDTIVVPDATTSQSGLVKFSASAPAANGTASAGTASTAARSDHIHPLQTTISGNANTATKLATARTIGLSGGATGTATSFDGSKNITIPVTSLDATKLSGIVPLACIPKGALERLDIVTNDTARLALTSTNVQSGDVVKVESTGMMYYVKDDTKLGTEDAFEAFSAGTAAAVAWSNITGKPNFATVATSGKYSDLSGTPTIPTASSTAGTALGTASAGTSANYARADHVHPLQTTISGNAATTTKLATARTIGLTGVTATAQSFDGSKNITIPVTAVPASIVTGLATVATSGKYSDLSDTPSIPSAATTTPKANGTAAVGTGTTWARADHVHPLQTTISGNAATATKLATARTIGLTGVTATAQSFNGSSNITIPVTAVPASIVTGLATVATSGKYSDLSGTPTIPAGATEAPKANGASASVGTSETWARADHVHPVPTVVGNATSATEAEKLANPVSIGLSGVTATAQEFDGTVDITIPITAVPASIITGLADVAKTGSYTNLINTPSIPSAATTTPKANGTAAVGTGTTWARADHVHPLQTTISGNAATATKLETARTIGLTGVTATAQSFNGSASITIPVTAVPASIVTGLATVATSGKYSDLSGTPTIPSASTVVGTALGTASAGTSANYARADHVHPLQTTVSGNAATSSKLKTAVNIGLTGVTATAQSFDGSKNITIPVTAVPASIVTGLATVATSGSYNDLDDTPSIPVASSTAPKANGTAAVGTGTTWARADHVHPLQTTISGNAATTTKLATARTIGLSGGATGTATSFDGSSNITIPVTSLDATKLTGTVPLSSIPQAALERLIVVTNDTARLALTTATAQSGDVVKVESTGMMYYVKDDTKLGTEDAFEAFSAGTASAVAWSNITGKPNFATVATSGKYSDLSGAPAASTVVGTALGTAAVGTSTAYARADHVHPLQTTISGNAATATKVNNSMIIKLNGGSTEGTSLFTYDGSAAKTINITPSAIGAAAASHGTHVTYTTTAPSANGTASAGSAGTVSRSDHVHPLQTTVSGNAGTATKLATARTIGLTGVTATAQSFDGSTNITIPVSAVPASIVTGLATVATSGKYSDLSGAPAASSTVGTALGTAAVGTSIAYARADHVHPLQTTITGNAGSATKVNNSIIVKLNGGTTEGTNLFTYDGSSAKTIDITPSAIGAAAASHGTHVTYSEDAPLVNAEEAVAGTSDAVARADHVHPLQEDIPGNAATATRLNNSLTIMYSSSGKINSSTGYSSLVFDGSSSKTFGLTPATIGASGLSHGTHVTFTTDLPLVASGSGKVGSKSYVSRSDHVHPEQTTISGNAGTATAFESEQAVTLTGDVTGTASSTGGWEVATTLAEQTFLADEVIGSESDEYTISVPNAIIRPNTDKWIEAPIINKKGLITGLENKSFKINTCDTLTAAITTTWTGNEAPYSQTINVDGLDCENPIVDIVLSGDYEADTTALSDYAKIYRITTDTTNETITVYASEKTEGTVNIQLKCVYD